MCVCVWGGDTRLTPHTYIYIKCGMRAFIIVRNYNNSVIISVVKHTGEDKDNFTRYICRCAQHFPINNTLCLTNSKTVYCLVFFFLSFFGSFALLFFLFFHSSFPTFVGCCFVLFGWFLLPPPPPFFSNLF